ncbi:hypothetical protein ABZ260_05215 [Streptosporangium sp. NPDC006013]|uniref:hypothetical protein n=1 Tax=Streptosporangium sp. NPDC006013 TaxID=3155596 RepID=UPI0033B51C65
MARAVRAARIRRVSWTLSPDVSSTPLARHLARTQLTDWGYDGESDTAELLVARPPGASGLLTGHPR